MVGTATKCLGIALTVLGTAFTELGFKTRILGIALTVLGTATKCLGIASTELGCKTRILGIALRMVGTATKCLGIALTILGIAFKNVVNYTNGQFSPAGAPLAGNAWEAYFSYLHRWNIEQAFCFGKSELAVQSPRLWSWQGRLKLLPWPRTSSWTGSRTRKRGHSNCSGTGAIEQEAGTKLLRYRLTGSEWPSRTA